MTKRHLVNGEIIAGFASVLENWSRMGKEMILHADPARARETLEFSNRMIECQALFCDAMASIDPIDQPWIEMKNNALRTLAKTSPN